MRMRSKLGLLALPRPVSSASGDAEEQDEIRSAG